MTPSAIKSCHVELYADGTLLYFSSKSVSTIECNLSEDLERIISWLNCIFLFLNYSKTRVMLMLHIRVCALLIVLQSRLARGYIVLNTLELYLTHASRVTT